MRRVARTAPRFSGAVSCWDTAGISNAGRLRGRLDRRDPDAAGRHSNSARCAIALAVLLAALVRFEAYLPRTSNLDASHRTTRTAFATSACTACRSQAATCARCRRAAADRADDRPPAHGLVQIHHSNSNRAGIKQPLRRPLNIRQAAGPARALDPCPGGGRLGGTVGRTSIRVAIRWSGLRCPRRSVRELRTRVPAVPPFPPRPGSLLRPWARIRG